MIRGLFFIEMRKPLPQGATLHVGENSIASSRDPAVIEFARLYAMLPEHRDRALGKAFSYVVAFGGGISAWMMLLYDYFMWIGTVDYR
jgi:hypothetical protein